MINLEKLTLTQVFKAREEGNLDEVQFSFVDEEPFTIGDVIDKAKAIQRVLHKQGVKKGDRVALLGENSPAWGVAYIAVGTMGGIDVPILPDFHKSEVHHILKNSDAKVLFVSSKLFHKILDNQFPTLNYIVVLDDEPQKLDSKDVVTLTQVLEQGAAMDEEIDVDIEEDDLLEILYTSGTTGHSKGVMLTHKNIISNALSAIDVIDVSERDKLLSILPMSHSYESTCGFITPFIVGAKVYYIKGLPTAQTLLPAVAKIKPTMILSVPLIMEKVYKKKVLGEINAKAATKFLHNFGPTRKLVHKIAGKKLYEAFGGNLRFMVFGGAATPPEVETFLTEGGFPYITGYGLSESAPILTVSPVGQQRAGSAGKVVKDVQIRIDDPDPETGIGEIVATGPNIMVGYYKNEEATKNTFTEDGWLITGDKGYIDKDGYLFIKGRSKNLIVGPSGENIYPEEIEFHVSQNNFVLEALVYESEGRIVARVHLDYDAIDKEHGTSKMDEGEASKIVQNILEDIKKNVNSSVASYSRIHKIIEQPEEFVKTPTKKIKRYLYTNS
ncbi:long-chain fatty acid--CoA ligase [candidate division KSB1 bacterium]|nr:AMP-binding protein [candidate division KSB1 bacterium]RQW04712.1 MAG: long-chain fatty acid--CoA ligase [candidate division KSB1 bacterium]